MIHRLILLAAWLAALAFVARAAPEGEAGMTQEGDASWPGAAWRVALPSAAARLAPTRIDLSTVNYVEPGLLPAGTALDLCFNVTVQTPDLEYMDRFEVDLPDGWTVHSLAPVPPTGCASSAVRGVDPGNVIYWQSSGALPTGCGAWGEGTLDFCASLTVPQCSGAPWSLAWTIVGDGYGAGPHVDTGSLGVECLGPGIALLPPWLQVQGCNGLPLAHTLRLVNNTGSDGAFDLAYAVPAGSGSLGGPAQVAAGQGQAVDFQVMITPALCTVSGLQVVGLVEAAGNGWSDSMALTATVDTDDRWVLAWSHPVACLDWLVESAVDPTDGLEYNYVAGCDRLATYRYDPRLNQWTTRAGTLPDELYDAGDGVAYGGHIYARSDGQASAIGRLYVYDVASDSWTWRAVLAGIADRMWYEAVEVAGKLYFLGGWNAALGQASAEVNRYDPVSGTWQTVAPLRHARAQAMAWAWNGKIYVAGGKDTDNSEMSSTEVYDPDSNTWTEDAAIFAPLPTPWCAAGDAVLDGRLWIIGGDKPDETGETLYWTPADNTWRAGPALEQATSQVEASVLAGEIYAVGGDLGGARLDYNQRLIVCPDCDQRGWLTGRVVDGELLPAGPACSPAALTLSPGALAVPVDPATGDLRPLALIPGSYQATAAAAGYQTETAALSITDGVTSVQQIALGRPQVATGPPAVQVATPYSLGITVTWAITNSGHVSLTYQIEEDNSQGAGGLPWVSATPSSGTLAPADNHQVDLAFLCSPEWFGQVLSGSLHLVHDDPCAAPLDVAVELQCQAPDVRVVAPPLRAALCPAANTTRVLSLCNQGAAGLSWSADTEEGSGWLSVSPIGGHLLPGTCGSVDLGLDASGLAAGEQTGILTISSNDPDEPQIGLPVTLTVLAAVGGTNLAWSPPQPRAGQVVSLTASVAAGSSPLTYTWDLGDGTGASGAAVEHSYAVAGAYALVLTAENRCGLETAAHLLRVSGPPYLVHLPVILRAQGLAP